MSKGSAIVYFEHIGIKFGGFIDEIQRKGRVFMTTSNGDSWKVSIYKTKQSAPKQISHEIPIVSRVKKMQPNFGPVPIAPGLSFTGPTFATGYTFATGPTFARTRSDSDMSDITVNSDDFSGSLEEGEIRDPQVEFIMSRYRANPLYNK